jgi:endonuclease/exonuclease/phosphatase family metal-dependent hydrolase
MRSPAFGQFGSQDLITESGITSTRTSLYRYIDEPGMTHYADWVFVSGDLPIKEFKVPEEPEVSDHRPLILFV